MRPRPPHPLADPGAFSELYWNVKMNPALSRKVEMQQLCISDAPGQLQMHGQQGASMSTLLDYPDAKALRKRNGSDYADWTVQCMTLQDFLELKGVSIHDVGLIKIDVEGAETKVLPQLKPWLAEHKPNILLSLHAYLFKQDTKAHEAIKSVIALYDHPIWLNGNPVESGEMEKFAERCHLCEMLLTQHQISREEIAAVKASGAKFRKEQGI